MNAALLEPMVRLPSGRIVGAEINDRGNLVPHEWTCDCDRCDPVAEAKRHRVRDAAPDLLAALVKIATAARSWHDFHHGSKTVQCDWICDALPAAEAAIAKATPP